MNKKIVIRIVLIGFFVIFLGVAAAVYIVFFKGHRDIAKTDADFTLSAAQLYNDYKANEKAANAKYLSEANGKVIEIKGTIAGLDTSDSSQVVISLKDNTMAGNVSCSVAPTELEKIKKFKQGDAIKLKGECTGYIELTDEVSLIKCVIIE